MKRGPAYLAACGAAIVLGLMTAEHAGYRVNTSASMPIGLWRVSTPPAQLLRGMIVVYCLKDGPVAKMALERQYLSPGRCPGGIEPILKPIVAIGGDVVTVTTAGIYVDGSELLHSTPLSQDTAGRPLSGAPPGEYHVSGDEVWLLSPYSNLSFDSRYYGAARITNITGVAEPVLTWHPG